SSDVCSSDLRELHAPAVLYERLRPPLGVAFQPLGGALARTPLQPVTQVRNGHFGADRPSNERVGIRCLLASAVGVLEARAFRVDPDPRQSGAQRSDHIVLVTPTRITPV